MLSVVNGSTDKTEAATPFQTFNNRDSKRERIGSKSADTAFQDLKHTKYSSS
jgi:hypothetical protein